MGLQHSHDLELYVCSERHVPAHVFNFTYLVWQPTTLTATVVVNSLHTSLCFPKYLTAFSTWQAAKTRCTAIRTWNVFMLLWKRQIFKPLLAVTRASIVRPLNTGWRRLASVYLILDGDISYRKSSIKPPPPQISPVPLIRPPPPFPGKKVNNPPPPPVSIKPPATLLPFHNYSSLINDRLY